MKPKEIREIKRRVEQQYPNAPESTKIKAFLEKCNSIARGC